MVINVNGDQIKNAGRFIKEKSNELTTKINEINDCLDKLNIVWKGNSSSSYILSMREKYIASLKELRDRISDCGEYLTKVPDTYSALDEAYANKNIGV